MNLFATLTFVGTVAFLGSCKPRSSELAAVSEKKQLSSLSQMVAMRYRHGPGSVSVAASADGAYFASVGTTIGVYQDRNEKLMIWNTETLDLVTDQFPLLDEDSFLGSIQDVAFEPSDKGIAVCGDRAVYYWPLDLSRETSSTPLRWPMLECTAIDFSEDGEHLFAVSRVDNQVFRLNYQKDTREMALTSPGDKFTDILAFPNTILLVKGNKLEAHPAAPSVHERRPASYGPRYRMSDIEGSGSRYNRLAYNGSDLVMATSQDGRIDYFKFLRPQLDDQWGDYSRPRLLELSTVRPQSYGPTTAAAFGRPLHHAGNAAEYERRPAFGFSKFEGIDFIATSNGDIILGLREVHDHTRRPTGSEKSIALEAISKLSLGGRQATSLANIAQKQYLIMGLGSGEVMVWRYNRVLDPFPVFEQPRIARGVSIAKDAQSYVVFFESGQLEQRSFPYNEIIREESVPNVREFVDLPNTGQFALLTEDGVSLRDNRTGEEIGKFSAPEIIEALLVRNNTVIAATRYGKLLRYEIGQPEPSRVQEVRYEDNQLRIKSMTNGVEATSRYFYASDDLGRVFRFSEADNRYQLEIVKFNSSRRRKATRPVDYRLRTTPNGLGLLLLTPGSAQRYRTDSVQFIHLDPKTGLANSSVPQAVVEMAKEYFEVGSMVNDIKPQTIMTTGSFSRLVRFTYADGISESSFATDRSSFLNPFYLTRQEGREKSEAAFADTLALSPDGRFAFTINRAGQLSMQWLTDKD